MDSYFEARREHPGAVYYDVDPAALFDGDTIQDFCVPGPPVDLEEAQSRLLWHRGMITCIYGALHSGRVAPGGEVFYNLLNLLERQAADVDHLRAWIAAQELGGDKEEQA
jgi:hypothetical protein